MTAKQFFKSQAFKCIVVLLSIVLVCGIFLTVCNSLFYVSAEEKLDRTISKIYGSEVNKEEIVLDGNETSFTYSTVKYAYEIKDDGNILVEVAGKNGHGGDVTCWVVVDMNDGGTAIEGIYKVVLGTVPSGEFTYKLGNDAFTRFTEDYEDGIVYDYGYKNGASSGGDMYISTGASESMRAISNAVNGAIDFVKAYKGIQGGNA